MLNHLIIKKYSVKDIAFFSSLVSVSGCFVYYLLEFKAEMLSLKEHVSQLKDSNTQLTSKIESLTSELDQAKLDIGHDRNVSDQPHTASIGELLRSDSVKITGIVIGFCFALWLLPESLNPVVYFYKITVPEGLQVWVKDNVPFMQDISSGVLHDCKNQLRFDGTVTNNKYLDVQVTLLDGNQTSMKLVDYILNLRTRTITSSAIESISPETPGLTRSASDDSLLDLVTRG